jgi:hypothetical protein
VIFEKLHLILAFDAITVLANHEWFSFAWRKQVFAALSRRARR